MTFKRTIRTAFFSLLVVFGFSSSAFAAQTYDHFTIQLSTLPENTHTFSYTITPQVGAKVTSGTATGKLVPTTDSKPSTQTVTVAAANNGDVVSAKLYVTDGKSYFNVTLIYTRSTGKMTQSWGSSSMSGVSASSSIIPPGDTAPGYVSTISGN